MQTNNQPAGNISEYRPKAARIMYCVLWADKCRLPGEPGPSTPEVFLAFGRVYSGVVQDGQLVSEYRRERKQACLPDVFCSYRVFENPGLYQQQDRQLVSA
jgi:hypothetical protein